MSLAGVFAKQMAIEIGYITDADVESFHACLDIVAREKRFLALQEAPPLEVVRSFVLANIASGAPQFVARADAGVVGWCDILPGWHHSRRHCGSLGIGVLPTHRGAGLGPRLLEACLARAKETDLTRIELEVREDNARAIKLYEQFGFAHEGVRRNAMRVDGIYYDTLAMSLVDPHS